MKFQKEKDEEPKNDFAYFQCAQFKYARCALY